MAKKPRPITRDQEFYDAILCELREIRLLLAGLGLSATDAKDNTCEVCGRVFSTARGLRAHMRAHKGEK